MRRWRARGEMPEVFTCAEVMRLLQAYLDGEVRDELSARRIAAHLEVCRRCGMEASTFIELKAALRRLDTRVDPATLHRLDAFGRRLGEDLDRAGGEE